MNKIITMLLSLIIVALSVSASLADGINAPGELSHVAGGALASLITSTIADKYWPEHRALVGFAGSTATVVVAEGIQTSRGEKFSNSLQDVFFHTIGAALGATVTDRFILTPVVTHNNGKERFGLMMQQTF